MTDEEAVRLITQYRRKKDQADKDKVVEAFDWVAWEAAKAFQCFTEYTDLKQEAHVGLLRAFDTFDPKRGVKFSTWCWHCAFGEVQHYLRDRDRLVRIAAWSQEDMSKVSKATEKLQGDLEREPLLSEVAEHTDLDERHVGLATVADAINIEMLYFSDQPADFDVKTWEDIIEDPRSTAAFEAADARILLDELVGGLPKRQRECVRALLQTDMGIGSNKEVAEIMGISQSHASHLKQQAIANMKEMLE
jgi:RNA polymerase sigma factor (sigma-70 family)